MMIPALAFLPGGLPGWAELLIVMVIVMLLFGPKRLPELFRAMGRSMSEFKKGRREGERPDDPASDEKAATSDDTAPPKA